MSPSPQPRVEPSAAAPRARATDGFRVEWLGRVPYAEALALQEETVARRRAGACGDRLLLLEHPPVITLGRSADPDHVRASPEDLEARGIPVVPVARGGDVTWHGPGQLVGYLVVDLAAHGRPDVTAFLRGIEDAVIRGLADLGVRGEARPGMTGVFVAGSDPPRKLASIGVGVRGWVSWHGFALNITSDSDAFRDILPCGLEGVEMTCVAREVGAGPDLFDRGRQALDAAFRSWLA